MNKLFLSLIMPKEECHSETTTGLKLGYRPELDGLRGISILLIYLHHLYYPLLPGGFLGVDIFFVLSGFLITCLLVEEWKQKCSINLKNFYIRRILRLMPAMFLLIIITGSFALIFLDKKISVLTYQGIWLTLSYASNWFYAFRYFSANNPLGITWSLAIEEQFYLTWPLLLSIAFRLKLGRRWMICILAFVIALIPLHRKLLADQGATIFRLYYSSDVRADALLIGCLVGLLFSWNLLPHGKRLGIWMRAFAVGAAVFFGCMVGTSSWTDPMLYQQGGYTLVALSVALILIVQITWPFKVGSFFLRFPPLVWIGRISYGLYLWHWPVRMFTYQGKPLPTSTTQLLIAVVLSLLLTSLSYYFVETKFLRWKKRYGFKR